MSNSIYRALTCLAARDAQPQKPFREELKSFSSLIYLFTIILPIVISIFLAIFAKAFDNPLVTFIALILLLLGYLGVFLYPVILAYYYRREILISIKNPFRLIIQNMRRNQQLDDKYLKYFTSRDDESLKLVLLELKSEKQAFSGRISLIVGSIDKIGLFPGLLALVVTLSQFNNIKYDWVLAAAYGIPVMYLFGVYSHFLLHKMSRYIELIEHVLKNKEDTISARVLVEGVAEKK